MKVIHLCQFKLDHSNGVQAAAWELACEQAKSGVEVEIVSLGRAPKVNEVSIAKSKGVILSGYAGGWIGRAIMSQLAERLDKMSDCLVHFHSIFVPSHARLARLLRKRNIPYVVSPHGNLASGEMARKRLKKGLYFSFFLRKKLSCAALILCASKAEVETVKSLIPNGNPRLLGNGLSPVALVDIPLRSNKGKLKGISMGKSDVENKGYDRMFPLASVFSGGVDFYVIRYQQDDHAQRFDRLAEKYSNDSSVRIHGPVYDNLKKEALASADVFFHLSRWEVFGMVFVEAAFAGMPIVVSKECDLAQEIEEAGAGLVVDADAPDVADSIRGYLASTEFPNAGKNAREWAIRRYSAAAVSERSLKFYQEVLTQ